MAEKVTFDGPNKLIIVNNGETDLDAERDIYSAWKRWLEDQNTYGLTSKYLQALRTVGGDTITATQDVSPYFFLLNGWVLRPYEASHLLTVDGNLFVDGGGNPFIPTLGAYTVTINLLTSSKSITTTVSVSSGSGLSQAESDQLFSLPAEDVISQEVWSEQVSAYTGMGSAGQVQQCLLYGNRVTLDADVGQSGTDFPIGTHRYPVNNLDDALLIAGTHGIDMLELHTDLTVEATHNISNLVIETIGIMGTTVTLTQGCSAANAAFRYLNLQGTLTNGDIVLVESCTVLGLDNFTGVMNVVALGQGAEITLGSWAEIIQATAGGSAGNEPEITINGAGLNMSHYTGNIKLKGKIGTDRTVLNSSSSNIILDSTCVSGTIQLLGTGFLAADNTGPNCTVDIEGFISNENIADQIWDETLDDHGGDGSTGKKLKDIGSSVILTGNAAGNGNGLNQIKLDSFGSSVDGAYDPAMITIVAGTGAGQSRGIYQYEGSTRTCTVDRNWKTQPTSASEYVISAWPGREHVNEGLAQGGTANTITLNVLASSNDNVYNHQICFIRSGTGEDQVGLILSYNGTTKIATVDKDWDIIPDTTTGYVLLPTHIDYADAAKAVWSEPVTAGDPDSAEDVLLKIKQLVDLVPGLV